MRITHPFSVHTFGEGAKRICFEDTVSYVAVLSCLSLIYPQLWL